jgi:hypothetical protein
MAAFSGSRRFGVPLHDWIAIAVRRIVGLVNPTPIIVKANHVIYPPAFQGRVDRHLRQMLHVLFVEAILARPVLRPLGASLLAVPFFPSLFSFFITE